MGKAAKGKRRASGSVRSKSTGTKTSAGQPPRDLASRIRGLYGRVARQLDVDPSYVSRVARGERQSEAVVAVLRRELTKIVQYASKWKEGPSRKSTREKFRKG